ncbi:MAG: hypothetical protein ACK4M2_01745 [Brevundimonas sp.]
MVVDQVSGLVVKSVTAESLDLARRYLQPGQALMTSPVGAINASLLIVREGVLMRRPDVPESGEILGEGAAVEIASTTPWAFTDA